MIAITGVEHAERSRVRASYAVVAAPQTVIEARSLEKVYGRGEGRVEALAGVSLSVGAGEWVSLIGPSGSGKSTLMNLLGLLDRPTSGRYALVGREVSGLKGGELSRARRELVEFVTQSCNLLPNETALANVELPLLYADVGHRKRRRWASGAKFMAPQQEVQTFGQTPFVLGERDERQRAGSTPAGQTFLDR